jgi:hypothetical protein
MKVKIYKPTQSLMQSGIANTKKWVLESELENTRFIEPVMGWTGNSDTKQQVKLKFDSKEGAVEFADKSGYEYQVIEPQQRRIVPKSYADNFTQ